MLIDRILSELGALRQQLRVQPSRKIPYLFYKCRERNGDFTRRVTPADRSFPARAGRTEVSLLIR